MKMNLIRHCSSSGCYVLAFSLIVLVAACASKKFTLESARSAAAHGNARASYFLAIHYANGDGVPRNWSKAASFMKQAAEAGYAPAENDLGAYYLQGWGVDADPQKAVFWFQRAADKGDALAMYSMGMCCEEGRGVGKDVFQAVEWYRKAACNKQSDAVVALDRLYLCGGGGLKQNYREAFKWAQIGGKLGKADCLNDLGFMYEHGFGIARNPEKAAELYLAAAEKGYARAYANLGHLYLDRLHLKSNFVTAYKWFLVGLHYGDGFSRHYIQEMNLKQLLTDVQKVEAEKQASEYEKTQQQQRAKARQAAKVL